MTRCGALGLRGKVATAMSTAMRVSVWCLVPVVLNTVPIHTPCSDQTLSEPSSHLSTIATKTSASVWSPRVNTIAHTTAHTGTSTGKAPALLCRTHTEFLQSVEGFNSCPCVSQRDLKFVKRYLFPPIPQCLPASFLHGKKLAHPRLQVSNSKF